MDRPMDLAADWAATLARVGGAPDPAPGRSLLSRYAEPHRHYHCVLHLTTVLSVVDSLALYAADAGVVRLAAWYHDAIYDPRRADNEERSARLAESELAAAGLPADTVTAVGRLVRVTAGHNAQAGDADAEVLCDADLAVLARSASDYDGYVAAVRMEYAHVDGAGWRTGRGAVLRGLLGRPQLFGTPPGHTWEPAARANLSRELATLTRPSGGASQPP